MRHALVLSLIMTTALAGCTATGQTVPQRGAAAPATADPSSTANPAIWPQAGSQGLVDPKVEALVTELMSRMSLEEKVGQMIQADISAITPADLRTYPLGSILAGGNSPPLGGKDRAPAKAWVETARAFRAVSVEERPGHVPIPIIFGIDAVHGNSNVVGATIFPHNIGLGAANDPDLVRRIGTATAKETAAAGIDWAFGPTLAVPQDDRWGRTYEGYSEDPALVARYAGAMVTGLQGEAGNGTIQQGRVAASAKHFLGDGGTSGGLDQGDTKISEAELISIHSAGYPPAVQSGVMTVMASFNSWNGSKMHGNESLLTGVLKGRMGFDGFIVGDWNGHGQLPGCTNTNCPATFNAGLDMAMAPDSWKGLYENTLAQARSGVIPMSRIDDAVRRILRVKAKLGLFERARPYEGRLELLGAPEHRALAREAVAKTLVLLKNDGALPIRSSANVLVAGPAANDIGLQSGGWTLSWQGDGNSNADFPNGQSIFAGIAEAMKAGGGRAVLSVDGSYDKRPDAAIVVFGEQPYAEMRGDVRTLEFQAGDKQALALLKKLKADGIPTVSVFLSGRPLWVNPEINASDAFVAAWLPGSEGSGVADVLIGSADGKPRRDFLGRLSFSWPKTAGQFTLNKGQPGYDPLFPIGYGLSYVKPGSVPALSEEAGVDASLANTSVYFARGAAPAPWKLKVGEGIAQRSTDGPATQEGAVALTWPAGARATFRIEGTELDLTREANADITLQMTYRLDAAAGAPVQLSMGGGRSDAAVDAKSLFTGVTGEWRTVRIPLKCFRDKGVDLSRVTAPFVLSAEGPFALSLAELRLVADPTDAICP